MAARKFLAPGIGYRTQPLRPLPLVADEPETVKRIASASNIADEPESDSDDLANYAKTADFWRTQQHLANVLEMQQVRPLLRAEDRIKDAMRRAKQAKRRDLKGEFLALNGMLERYRKDDQEPKPGSTLLSRLERVEATLDGVNTLAA